MTSASPRSSQNTSLGLILITAGTCIALAAGLDFFALLFPDPTPTSVDWRLNTVTQLVDRGVIPLLGFSLILFGRWVVLVTEGAGRKRSLGALSTIAFIASGLLGLTYLGLAPFHFRDSGIASTNAITQLNRQVEQAEQQLDSQLNQELNAISGLISDENQLKQLQNPPGTITAEQQQQIDELLNQIETFKSDPTTLEAKAQESREQFLAQIRLRKANVESQIQTNYWKSAIRIPLSSLLLTIGYLFVAISGFQVMGR
ncbi:MAG: HpsJ family protein [Prochlorotrichaceae cyanobacterium]